MVRDPTLQYNELTYTFLTYHGLLSHPLAIRNVAIRQAYYILMAEVSQKHIYKGRSRW